MPHFIAKLTSGSSFKQHTTTRNTLEILVNYCVRLFQFGKLCTLLGGY